MEPELIEGKMYIWKLPMPDARGNSLYSVMFIDKEKKKYEVVFAKPVQEGDYVSGWYLVEKKKQEPVEDVAVGGDLSIGISDSVETGEAIG